MSSSEIPGRFGIIVVIALTAGIILSPLIVFVPIALVNGQPFLAAGVCTGWAAVWVTTRSAATSKKWGNRFWAFTALLFLAEFLF